MPEYNEYRCCMCPRINDNRQTCPGIPGTPHPNETACSFVKRYRDSRGWEYFVRSGIGGTTFKTFYRKPGKTGGGHGWPPAQWHDTFDEAQADLNREAKKRGWGELI